MLEVKNLHLSYDGERNIIDGLDFSLRSNEIVLIGGQTGSGKSTLAHCISGFISSKQIKSISGNIKIDDESVMDTDVARVARKVALVQQDPESQICTLRVVDEIVFGPENYQMESEAIKSVLQRSLESMDADYLYDRTTHALSGGERQRIVIASLLASRPDYMILDEPTSSLDPKGLNSLKIVLSQLRSEGMGILCIEHNIRQLNDIADRILLLRDGILVPALSSQIRIPKLPAPMILDSEETTPLISAHHLRYSYGDRLAIDDASIEIHPGEIIALMGDNGSGKTTLISLLSGLLIPNEGQVTLDGRPMISISREDAARRISVVFQNPNHQIFERTVWRDQVLAIDLLGLESARSIEASERLLREVGLGEKFEQNPFSLSYGQKRRLNITSTSFYDPAVYLLDEPFIGQDSEGIEFIAAQIQFHQKQKHASIISTHDPNFAIQCCTRLIFMRKGKILVDGTPGTVMRWLLDNGEPDYLPKGGSPQ